MNKIGRKQKPWQEHFKDRLIYEEGGCISWSGRKTKKGFPKFSSAVFGGGQSPYKLAYIIFKGEPPSERVKWGQPNCGSKICLNPDHFAIFYCLNNRDIKDIKKRWALSKKYSVTMENLGSQYGITKQRVEQIVNEKED